VKDVSSLKIKGIGQIMNESVIYY